MKINNKPRASSAPWDLTPHLVEEFTDNGTYAAAAADILAERGLTIDEPIVRQLIRLDLEGDGVEEVLVVVGEIKAVKEQLRAIPHKGLGYGVLRYLTEDPQWRAALGPVDLVLIDANHNYHAVTRDIAINRAHPHRFLAVHDITGARRATAGVRRAWEEITDGHKLEIIRPHRELGLGRSTMGIGIWSASEE